MKDKSVGTGPYKAGGGGQLPPPGENYIYNF
jgi:hypothetical protein